MAQVNIEQKIVLRIFMEARMKRISLEKLGEMTGINPSQLWRIRRLESSPRLSTLIAICNVLELEIKLTNKHGHN